MRDPGCEAVANEMPRPDTGLAVTIWCECDHDIGLQIVFGFMTIQSPDWPIRPG